MSKLYYDTNQFQKLSEWPFNPRIFAKVMLLMTNSWMQLLSHLYIFYIKNNIYVNIIRK